MSGATESRCSCAWPLSRFGMVAREGLNSKLPEKIVLLTWTSVPPTLMYLYSYIFQPIFGPPRYHLFIAPAYLILLAHGLSKLPVLLRWPIAAAGFLLSLSLLSAGVYDRSLKSDWRGLARWLEQQARAGGPDTPVTIVVHPSEPRFPRDQVEAARYYLAPKHIVVLTGNDAEMAPAVQSTTYDAYCLSKAGDGSSEPDARLFPGLVVKERRTESSHQ